MLVIRRLRELSASQWNFISRQNLTTLNLVNFIMHTPGEYDGRNWQLELQWSVGSSQIDGTSIHSKKLTGTLHIPCPPSVYVQTSLYQLRWAQILTNVTTYEEFKYKQEHHKHQQQTTTCKVTFGLPL